MFLEIVAEFLYFLGHGITKELFFLAFLDSYFCALLTLSCLSNVILVLFTLKSCLGNVCVCVCVRILMCWGFLEGLLVLLLLFHGQMI